MKNDSGMRNIFTKGICLSFQGETVINRLQLRKTDAPFVASLLLVAMPFVTSSDALAPSSFWMSSTEKQCVGHQCSGRQHHQHSSRSSCHSGQSIRRNAISWQPTDFVV